MKASLLPLAIFAILVVFLSVGLTLDPARVPSPLVGQSVPAFSGERLSYPGIVIGQDDLSDRPMLVNVWGTWCQGCLAEHELLMGITEQYGIPVYGLNYRDRRELALEWLDRYGNPYRLVVYDPDARISLEWGVYGAPETFAVDSQGIIRYRHVGILTREILENRLLPAVAGRLDEERNI